MAVYKSMYPDSSVEKMAKREWCNDIIAKSGSELIDCFKYAKEQLGTNQEWKFPNIGLILRGRPQVKRSHRDWRDNAPATHAGLEHSTARLEAPPLTGRAKAAHDSLSELLR